MSTELSAQALQCVTELGKLTFPGAETGRSAAVQLTAQLAPQRGKKPPGSAYFGATQETFFGCMRSLYGTGGRPAPRCQVTRAAWRGP